MPFEWIKPGMRVRCIYQGHPRYGKLATVRDILTVSRTILIDWDDNFWGDRSWSYARTILIDWDDNFWGDRSWSYEDSFEPLESPPKIKIAKLKKELETLEAKPIKRERDISRIYYLRKQCETL